MKPSVTGSQLQQFVCDLQWEKTAIPYFTAMIEPLHRYMETVYDRAGSRTKRGLSKVLLSAFDWGKNEIEAFHLGRTAIMNQVTLPHRKPDSRLTLTI